MWVHEKSGAGRMNGFCLKYVCGCCCFTWHSLALFGLRVRPRCRTERQRCRWSPTQPCCARFSNCAHDTQAWIRSGHMWTHSSNASLAAKISCERHSAICEVLSLPCSPRWSYRKEKVPQDSLRLAMAASQLQPTCRYSVNRTDAWMSGLKARQLGGTKACDYLTSSQFQGRGVFDDAARVARW